SEDNVERIEDLQELFKITYNPVEYIREKRFEGQILLIEPDEGERFFNEFTLEESKTNGLERIKSGEVIKIFNGKWNFIPFNLNPNLLEDYDAFCNHLNKELNLNLKKIKISAKDILDEIKKRLIISSNGNKKFIADLKKSCWNFRYFNSSPKRNKYSLCMYSGSVDITEHHSCLYTGDYNAKANCNMLALKRNYKQVENRIDTLQIPHHGSILNFHDDLIFENVKQVIFSVNKDSKDHTGKEVTEKIDQKNSNIRKVIINQFSNSYIW
ncbi:MAG: hypothetical protein ACRCZ2_08105, partial [Fusobacteriaceae bacterium]